MITDLQKKVAQAIVQIFETSKLEGADAYAQVTLLKGDTGGLTYGKEQTTLMSGNLYLLIQDYVDNKGAVARKFIGYLDRMMLCDSSLNRDANLHAILREAGRDPIMHQTQDAFFDRVYWNPAVRAARTLALSTPLSFSVVYDSFIHGSWKRIRDRVGLPTPVNFAQEQQWITTYLNKRKEWLGTHPNMLLRKTVYRQNTYLSMVQADRWGLQLPLIVRGVKITPEILGASCKVLPGLDDCEPVNESAKDGSDVMRLLVPLPAPMIGQDVALIQRALSANGYPVNADGVYGPATVQCVKMYQQGRGLKADGIVGPATRSALGIV